MVRRMALVVAAILMGTAMLAFESRAQSIHPFYEDDDVVVRHELLGKWQVAGIPVEFAAAPGNAYVVRLALVSDSMVCFFGHLIRLNGRYFLDVQVEGFKMPSNSTTSTTADQDTKTEVQAPQSDSGSEIGSCSENSGSDHEFLNREHMLFLMKFTSDPDSFEVVFWNDTWASEMAEENKFTVPFTKTDDDEKRVLFFGSRSEMRDLVISLPEEAFDDVEHLERMSSTAAGPNDERNEKIGLLEAGGEAELTTLRPTWSPNVRNSILQIV